MHGPSGQGEGGRTGELCFNHSLIHTNLSWNKSLSLTKKKVSECEEERCVDQTGRVLALPSEFSTP